MKKYLVVIIAIVLIQVVIPYNAAAQTNRKLSVGTEGSDVSWLQQILSSDATIYPQKLITGYFGKLTEIAVKALQYRIGLEVIGIVGPKTRAFLDEISRENPDLLLAAVVTSSTLNAPTNLAATGISASSIQLTWSDTNSDESKYIIEQSLSSSTDFTKIKETASNVTSTNITGLKPLKTYYYRVRAAKLKPTLTYSPYSDIASITTGSNDKTPPTIPSTVTATTTNCTQIKISWKASTDTGGSGLAGYNVYRNNTIFAVISAPTVTVTDSDLIENTTYSYSVTSFDNAGNKSIQSTPVNIKTPACVSMTNPSWPIRVAYGGWNFVGFGRNSPAVSDINNDGYAEIAIGSTISPTTTGVPNPYGGDLYIWDHTGATLPGWPKHFGYDIVGTPVFVDLDPNFPNKEIIFAVQGAIKTNPSTGLVDGMAVNSKIYAYHSDGSIVTGWPKEVNNLVASSPVAGDVDADGKLEVMIGAQAYGNPNTDQNSIFIWQSDGTPLSGWPKNAGNAIVATPALADLNRDGKLDIIVGLSSSGFNGNRGLLYAWNYDGTNVAGWPQQLYNSNGAKADIRSSAAVGDIDGDGNYEIVVGGFGFSNSIMYVFNNDGSIKTGWPQIYAGAYSSPALADLDGDSKSEIILGVYDGKIHVWHHDGTVANGFPVISHDPLSSGSPVIVSSPVIADLNGDGNLDIAVGSHSIKSDFSPVQEVFAFHGNGSSMTGFPIVLSTTLVGPLGVLDPNGTHGNSPEVDGSPAVQDINNDGKIDLIFGSNNGYVYVLPMLGTNTNIKWKKFHSDDANSGLQN